MFFFTRAIASRARAQTVYETFEGWQEDISQVIQRWKKLRIVILKGFGTARQTDP
jgi:adenylosuccinate synthase